MSTINKPFVQDAPGFLRDKKINKNTRRFLEYLLLKTAGFFAHDFL
nr:hypothetical protein [uncultured Desulfobacter sp.]